MKQDNINPEDALKVDSNKSNSSINPTFDDSALAHPDTFVKEIQNGTFSTLPADSVNPGLSEVEIILANSKIDLTKDICKPPNCIEIKSNGQLTPIGTYGNFSAIIGKAKSKKTFFVTMIIAAALNKKLLLDTFLCTLPANKTKVVFFDTEQSAYHTAKVGKRVLALIGQSNNNFFDVFTLRRYNPDQRLNAIEYYIYNTHDISLLIIDGIRDLVFDINDSDEAIRTVTRLMKWTEERQIHVIVVLHQNKGDNNARGHLGTEITNKAETIISITKNPENREISIAEAEYSRDKEFDPFQFSVDENGLPYINNELIQTKSIKAKSIMPTDISKETHIKILSNIFKAEPSLTYSRFCSEIMAAFGQSGVNMGVSKAKMFVAHYTQNEMVVAKPKQKGNTTLYFLSDEYKAQIE